MDHESLFRTYAEQRTYLEFLCTSEELNDVEIRIVNGETPISLIKERSRKGKIASAGQKTLNDFKGDNRLLVRGRWYPSSAALARAYGLNTNTVQKRVQREKTGNDLIEPEERLHSKLLELELILPAETMNTVYDALLKGIPIDPIHELFFSDQINAKAKAKANSPGRYSTDRFKKNPDQAKIPGSLYIARIGKSVHGRAQYKIGISSNGDNRLKGLRSQLQLNVLKHIRLPLGRACELEKQCLTMFKENKTERKDLRRAFDGKGEVLFLNRRELKTLLDFVSNQVNLRKSR